MASSSSSFLLAVAVMATLLAVVSCGSEVTFTIGKGSSANKLELESSEAISDVSVKQKGAMDWSDDLKESPAKTFTLDSKEEIKTPVSVRFSVKGGGYRVVDDLIPEGFKAGSVYKTGIQI